ncbi:MAG: transcriptional regulator [Spirochaetes bacterium]|nr:transcriptional regulator [Spirochaetota bacterium]MBU1079964.1 transcriptional regulator [Spirochaetota bacterium]
MPDAYDEMADSDFSRARLREALARIGGFLSPGRRGLLALDEVRAVLKIRGEEYKGVIPVPLEMIIGSEGRYRDFARGFLPRHDYLRDRWVRVDSAHYHDVILPPVRLYELGGAYFVRDGNHRVSVAKLQGAVEIDAEVVSLSSTVRIDKGMGMDDVKRALIDYEKREFYAQTLFGQATEDYGLDFTSPGAYDQVVEHILVHKYYINQGVEEEIDFVTALDSWYRTVYAPIVGTIRAERLASRFPGRTTSDLYLYIVKHWDALKRRYGLHYPASEAARDFGERYGQSLSRRVRGFLSKAAAFAADVFKGR